MSGIQLTFLIRWCFLFPLTTDWISLFSTAHGKSCVSIVHMLYIWPFRKVNSIFVSVLNCGGGDCGWLNWGPSTVLRINKESLNKQTVSRNPSLWEDSSKKRRFREQITSVVNHWTVSFILVSSLYSSMFSIELYQVHFLSCVVTLTPSLGIACIAVLV